MGAAGADRSVRRNCLPFARGPHGEAVPGGPCARMHLSSGAAGLRLWPQAGGGAADSASDRSDSRGGVREPEIEVGAPAGRAQAGATGMSATSVSSARHAVSRRSAQARVARRVSGPATGRVRARPSPQRTPTLQSQNESLQARVATLADDQRIERLAAGMGMVMPTAGMLTFEPAHRQGQLGRAIANIHAPDPSAFAANLASQIAKAALITPAAPATSGANQASGSTSAAGTGGTAAAAGGAGTTTAGAGGTGGTASSGTTTGGGPAASATPAPAVSATPTTSGAPTTTS